jgi:hypothetical protein
LINVSEIPGANIPLMLRSRTAWIVAGPFFACLALVSSVQAQNSDHRLVIGTNVSCRTAPDQNAAKAHAYVLGEIITVQRTAQTNQEKWYFDSSHVSGRSPSCWISAALTTPFDYQEPEPALVAIADHVLQRRDAVPFEDYVAVDNLFSGEYAEILRASGLLQFRQFEVIAKAIRAPGTNGREVARLPLRRAWMQAHDNVIFYFEPGDDWNISPKVLWQLHSRYTSAPWAENLAWFAAEIFVPSDECYSDCTLSKILQTYAEYWSRHPSGTHIDAALNAPLEVLKYAEGYGCEYDKPSDVLSKLTKLRTAMAKVSPSKGQSLRDSFSLIEMKCRSAR